MAIQTPPIKKGKPGEDKMAQAQAAKRPPVVAPAPPKKVVVPARTVLKNSTPIAASPKAAPIPSYGRAMTVPKTLVRPPLPAAKPRTDNVGLPGRGGAPGQFPSTRLTLDQMKAQGSSAPMYTGPVKDPTMGQNLYTGFMRNVPGIASDFYPPTSMAGGGIDANMESLMQDYEMMQGLRNEEDPYAVGTAGAFGYLPLGIGAIGKLLKTVGAPVTEAAIKAVAKFFPKSVVDSGAAKVLPSGESMAKYLATQGIYPPGVEKGISREVGAQSAALKVRTAEEAAAKATADAAAARAAKVAGKLTPAQIRAEAAKKAAEAVKDARELSRLKKLYPASSTSELKAMIKGSKITRNPVQSDSLAKYLASEPDSISLGSRPLGEKMREMAVPAAFAGGLAAVLGGLSTASRANLQERENAKLDYGPSASQTAASTAVQNSCSFPPPAAPIVGPLPSSGNTSYEDFSTPSSRNYMEEYINNKNSRDRDAGTTTAYDPEKDAKMIQIGDRLFMMSAPERQAAVEAIMDQHTQELMAGGQTTFTQEQIKYLQGFYAGPDQNPAATAAAAAAAAAAASGGGGGKGASIEIPPALQAPPANTGVPEPTTWAEQMARYQDMQNMFNKPVPEPDRTRENELYALLQSSQSKQDQLTQQYMELLMKQLTQQQQQQPGIPAVPAPATGSPSGNAFPLSNISQVARQGSNLQFSNAGLGYLNSIDPALLQALMQFLKAQQYTAMGQMGTYGELNYGRAGGVGPLTMSDASFENPLNYAGLTTQMREPAEAGLRSVFAQMGLMG